MLLPTAGNNVVRQTFKEPCTRPLPELPLLRAYFTQPEVGVAAAYGIHATLAAHSLVTIITVRG